MKRGLNAIVAVALTLGACAGVPPLDDAAAVDRPLLRYEPLGRPRATIIALHGFNDRKAAFLPFGSAAAAAGVRVLAYDQAAFGANTDRGGWAGSAQLAADLFGLIDDARRLSPDRPLVVLGESMGAAVAMAALARPEAPLVDGLILSAPAVWAGDQLNPLFRIALWLVAGIAPDADFTGRGLDIQASDNIPMLIALGRDPYYLATARARALQGLVRVMDEALASAGKLAMPRLVLIGERDEVVPEPAFEAFIAKLEPDRCAVIRYPEGWHLLLRDLGRDEVASDILAWIAGGFGPTDRGQPCAPPLA